MSFSIARSATHVMLVMGIVSVISLFFADMSASPSAFYLLAAFGVLCLALSFFFRRFCKCPHCGKSIILYRRLPPACPFCEKELSGMKP